MPTKTIRLRDAGADELQQLLSERGESEEFVLRQAVLRGIRDLWIEQGIRAFEAGRGSTVAAQVAGLPHAEFVHPLIDRGVLMLNGPTSLAADVEALGERFGDARLTTIALSMRVSQA
jgi:predicted transcriptional regulator